MIRRTFLCLLAVMASSGTIQSQNGPVYVNRLFQVPFGGPLFTPILNSFGAQWSRSFVNSAGEQLTIGHTYDSSTKENLLLIKHDADGSPVFTATLHTGGANFDYGLNLWEDGGSGDIYVCGTTDNGGMPNPYRALIARYDATGNFQDSVTIGAPGLNYIATAVTRHPNTGNLLVSIAAEGGGTGFDYLVVELDPTNLAYLNSNIYDYSGLDDIPLGIEIEAGGNDIEVIGSSKSTTLTCAYAVAVFDGNSLGFISDSRTNLSGGPNDLATSYVKDSNDNIYITGKTYSGSNANIKTVKINSSYAIAWTYTLDVGQEDVGSSIAFDALNGQVVTGGFVTNSSGKKEMVCIRHNAATGGTVSMHRQAAEDPTGDAVIKKLVVNPQGNVYFTGGEKGKSGHNQSVVGRINANGTPSWQKKIALAGQDVVPSDIAVTGDGIYAVSVRDSSSFNAYVATKFTEFASDTSVTYNNKGPVHMKRELVVGFMPSVVDKDAVDGNDGKVLEYGSPSDFLTTTAAAAITAAFSEPCRDCEIKMTKIHPYLKTTDTVAISRLGQNVPIPPFWADFVLEFPSYLNIGTAESVLRTLPQVVSYVHPNFIGKLHNAPNDSLYKSQTNFNDTMPPDADINVEEAWNLEVGRSFVKGGVFDSGIHWKHEEFGYTGTPTSSRIEGWQFYGNGYPGNGKDHKQVAFPDSIEHGTCVAGIIGASRNNGKGIAGIAGGDATMGNHGVRLFSLGHLKWRLSDYVEAIFESTRYYAPYGYGLNFGNHSLGFDSSFVTNAELTALSEAIRFATRQQVTQIVSRGYGLPAGSQKECFPATYDSCWVISVGGTSSIGHYKDAIWEEPFWSPHFGKGVDVAAPCVTNLGLTTGSHTKYTHMNGVSIAVPHVSGVVALLMSYMNDSITSYRNLAPEDCEFIINHSATDVNAPGYDIYTGYGRLNAGKALKMVEKPERVLYHFGTNTFCPHTITKSVYSNSDTIVLTERYTALNNIPNGPGRYIVKTFQIDANVSHPGLYPSDSLIAYWPRHSSSYVFGLPDAQKRLNMHERMQVVSLSPSNAHVRGYIYQVWDTIGNPPVWWPCDTSFAALFSGNNPIDRLFEYSILSKNKAVGIKEQIKNSDKIKLFPNPADRQQTLIIESGKASECIVDLYDLTGRFVKTVYKGRSASSKITVVHHLEGLPPSMYIYVIRLDGEILNKKFIKE